MKPPPFLLAAALLFWGWQSGLLIVGAILAVVIESPRFIRARWDFSDEDFGRIWTLCSLLTLGAILFAFVDNQGPANFAGFFQEPNIQTQRGAGSSSARTAFAMFRWLPMVYFPFILAQLFSTREAVPWKAISYLVRRRFKKAREAGKPAPPVTSMNFAMPYFALTLVGAAAHPPEGITFFWGLSVLLAGALWSQRSVRFKPAAWLLAVIVGVALGFLGQTGVRQAMRLAESMNLSWLSFLVRRRFDAEQSRTALGKIGDIKTSGQIVIRLEPLNGNAPPTYLREASYRTYKGVTWLAEINEEGFESVGESGQNTLIWPLPPLQQVTNTHAANIACYLDGGKALLPLPTGSARLEKLNIIELKKSPLGAVLARGPGLAIFDAHFTDGRTIDSPPEPADRTNIPPREVAGLDTALAELRLEGNSDDEKLRNVAGYFSDKFSYSTWQAPSKSSDTNETAISRFLTKTRKGHCEYFATATVLMLRKLNIPARYAVGFYVHESGGGGYVVRMSDAHAWTLVWDERAQTWRDFDTTPPSWMLIESKPTILRWLSDVKSRIFFEIRKLITGQTKLRQYLLWAIIPGLAILTYQIVFRRRKKQRGANASGLNEFTDWPGLDSEFYSLEKRLAERGVPREPGEPLSEWLKRVAGDSTLEDVREPLEELLRLHYRHRFDPQGLVAEEREALRRNTTMCLERIGRVETQAAR